MPGISHAEKVAHDAQGIQQMGFNNEEVHWTMREAIKQCLIHES
jgi:hypothetical protein